MKRKVHEWFVERLVYLAGALLIIALGSIFFFLASESRHAFERKFSFGFRFALREEGKPDAAADLTQDPNAAILVANFEGSDGFDDKEEAVPAFTLEEVRGSYSLAVAATDYEGQLYRDDWRTAKNANKGDTFKLFAFATPEYRAKKMVLVWEPDVDFDPKTSPYDFRLTLAKAPAGSGVEGTDLDLKKQPKGQLTLPTYVASTDEERTQGYVFELRAVPREGNFAATIKGLASTDWQPTAGHPRFGFVPLLLGTLSMAAIAIIIAAPLGTAAALFLSEIASARVREWVKPVIEMLASIPTVVLGYFGLMLLAPALQKTAGEALHMESGRSMITASLMLAFLLLPTVISLAEDALRAVPNALRDSAFAIGCTSREAIKNVILPAARAGIVGASLLAFARAVGETMIIWMLSGGTPSMPSANPLKTAVSSVRGITDTIAIETPNVEFGGAHYGHLFLIALILFAFTLVINLSGFYYARSKRWQS